MPTTATLPRMLRSWRTLGSIVERSAPVTDCPLDTAPAFTGCSRELERRVHSVTEATTRADRLATLDSLSVAVLTDDVSDNYVSKTPFAVSEFSNVVLGGASVISGEALLCANLGYGLRLVSHVGGTRHTMLFDTGPEAAIYLRNCTNLGIPFG